MRVILRRIAVVAVLMLLACGAARAQKIKVEFDKNVDFANFKTYAWDPTPQAYGKPALALAIKAAVDGELTKRGLTKVADNPDLYVAMYGGIDSDMAVTYSDFYYGPGGIPPFDQSVLFWGGIPGTSATAVVHKGQLVVDLIDARPKKLVWRGVATQKLSDQQMKLLEQVDAAVDKLFEKYPPKK